MQDRPRPQTVLINGSFAPSLLNFRGDLIAALIARGHKVFVTAPDILAEQKRDLRRIGAEPISVKLSRTGRGLTNDINYLLVLRSIIKRIHANAVINYTIKPNIWGTFAAQLTGARSYSMVTGLGYVFIPGQGLTRKITQWLAKLLYRQATRFNRRVIFQNPDDVRDFCEAGCLLDQSKAVIVNGSGIDLEKFQMADMPQEVVFLTIARLLGTKGMREYAAAALQLIERGSNARFQIAGFIDEGPDAIRAEELDRWIKGGIEYLGPLSDVREALRKCSVYVLPSYREGTPRTVLEAMAIGRPVITTDAPGCRETVTDGLNGLLVPVADTDALIDAMLRLATDPAARNEMAVASLARARAKYDVKKVNEAILAICSL